MENASQTTNQNSASQRFTIKLLAEFKGISGQEFNFNDDQKRLAQHMFVKCDAVLKELEQKRVNDNKNNVTPYTWDKINISKLAIDSVHRIEIGLDALIDNHVSVIPYYNKKLQAYDLDLRIGYTGKDFYKENWHMISLKILFMNLFIQTMNLQFIKRIRIIRLNHMILKLKIHLIEVILLADLDILFLRMNQKTRLLLFRKLSLKKQWDKLQQKRFGQNIQTK